MKPLLVAAFLAIVVVAAPHVGAHATAIAADAKSYAAHGAIRAIAPDRRAVTIAHEAIPGFMGAMTMSFEAAAPDQLGGLVVGDRVRFSFTATDDGRRVLRQIAKETGS